jgi:nucleotide-binding universal stress UspA family protein
MYKHILIPTDGSELSKMALSYRVRVGSAYGLQFVRQIPRVVAHVKAICAQTLIVVFGSDIQAI